MSCKDKDKQVTCKECNVDFKSTNSLHRHLKSHGMNKAEYYSLYFPRKDKYSGAAIPFKNLDQYFTDDFINKGNMRRWCKNSDSKEVQEFMLKKLESRIAEKELKYAPCMIDLDTSKMPTIFNYESAFGSYQKACEKVNAEPMFPEINEQVSTWKKDEEVKMFIDTREQDPLYFKNSMKIKIDVGDYLLQEDYAYTYVDRKSFEDFRSTMSSGFERFCEEIERAITLDSYLFVVVESDVEKSDSKKGWKKKVAPISFTYNRMRQIVNKYPRRVQFVFSGSRETSKLLIPNILREGKSLWNCDIQRSIHGLV